MSLWYRDGGLSALDQDRALYALIVATSHYDYLPTQAGQPGPQLQQLDYIATGAFEFAKWLRNEYHNPRHPLGAIRLCLSPSPNEIANVQQTDGTESSTVQTELEEWRTDCADREEALALFYVAGHGVKYGAGEGAVLLQDYQPTPDWLKYTVEVERVRDGLAGVGDPEEQLYFADACRAPLPAGFRPSGTGVGFNPPNTTGVARAPVFFSAASGAYAVAQKGSSVFTHALLRCLRGEALDLRSGNSAWRVSPPSLQKGLERIVRSLTNGTQWPRPKDIASFCFHEHTITPRIDYTFTTDPPSAASGAHATLWRNAYAGKVFDNRAFTGGCIVENGLEVGDYEFELLDGPAKVPPKLACLVHPDCNPFTLEVE